MENGLLAAAPFCVLMLPMVADKPIREVMSTKITMVESKTPLQDAIASMASANIGAIIVQENGQPKGIFTERDLLKRVVGKGLPLEGVTIGDVMTPKIISVGPETILKDVVKKMYTMAIRHIVIEENSQVVGIFSIRDVMRQLTLDWA